MRELPNPFSIAFADEDLVNGEPCGLGGREVAGKGVQDLKSTLSVVLESQVGPSHGPNDLEQLLDVVPRILPGQRNVHVPVPAIVISHCEKLGGCSQGGGKAF